MYYPQNVLVKCSWHLTLKSLAHVSCIHSRYGCHLVKTPKLPAEECVLLTGTHGHLGTESVRLTDLRCS